MLYACNKCISVLSKSCLLPRYYYMQKPPKFATLFGLASPPSQLQLISKIKNPAIGPPQNQTELIVVDLAGLILHRLHIEILNHALQVQLLCAASGADLLG